MMTLSILLGSLVAPETAHAQDRPAGHLVEFLVSDVHADADDDGSRKQQSGAPCHAVVHHHCNMAISPDAEGAALIPLSRTVLVGPFSVAPMASLALAPPTEPPAAA
ncbi:hypothetical protein [Novosphingobium cyanobacteriorum]|uniref:Uncharacterized protein n=1 Tax=Novosphingobium cyanobacteriorum TaxID=3024215 RepID=A0ABT6CNH3_9SPHN|nr:hypothetical protein [Novosphingobium cyanobacteriorum]MDF8335459.1 hypothetical protein [Novosphingobium cyanobacteriorum]